MVPLCYYYFIYFLECIHFNMSFGIYNLSNITYACFLAQKYIDIYLSNKLRLARLTCTLDLHAIRKKEDR